MLAFNFQQKTCQFLFYLWVKYSMPVSFSCTTFVYVTVKVQNATAKRGSNEVASCLHYFDNPLPEKLPLLFILMDVVDRTKISHDSLPFLICCFKMACFSCSWSQFFALRSWLRICRDQDQEAKSWNFVRSWSMDSHHWRVYGTQQVGCYQSHQSGFFLLQKSSFIVQTKSHLYKWQRKVEKSDLSGFLSSEVQRVASWNSCWFYTPEARKHNSSSNY